MKKRILAVLGAVILAGGAWYWLSPGIAMHGLKEAARSGDKDQLNERVDFPAVRDSLKSQFRAVMAAEMAKEKDNPFGALGMAFASVVIDPMIDGAISPEGIKTMVANGRMKAPASSGETASSGGRNDVDWQIERKSFDTFLARPTVADGERAPMMVFRRDGFGWKLVEIEVPVKMPAAGDATSVIEGVDGRPGQ